MNVANPATEWLRCNIPQQGRARTFGRPKIRGRRVLIRQPAPLLRSDGMRKTLTAVLLVLAALLARELLAQQCVGNT